MRSCSSKRICVSIACQSVSETLEAMRRESQKADVLEVRLDYMADPAVRPLMGQVETPLLFTNRAAWEGGLCKTADPERLSLLSEAALAGAAYVDLELKTAHNLRQQLLVSARSSGTKVIISWHNFSSTPGDSDLAAILSEQMKSGAHVGKIVTMAHDEMDVLRVLELQQAAQERNFPLIAFCMGNAGMISRFATLWLGGYMTYAAPDSGMATAPGQLSVSALRRMMDTFCHGG